MKATASPKRLKRQAPGNLRLEQRLMFDGAVADTVVDEIPLETQISSAAPPAISPVVENEVPDSNLVSYPDSQPPANLESAEALTHSALHKWFSNPDYLQQAADFFSANAGSTEWQSNALELQSAVLDGEYNIQVKLLDSTTLSGALGGYSSSGTDGEATIYLNEQWLSIATPEAIQSVLLEEIGHDFDHILNNGLDTEGDEGQHFSSHILNNPDNSNYQGDDHKQIDIDGILVTIEQAGLSITDSNGGDSGDISVSEDSTLTAQTFNVLPLNDVTSIEIEGVEIVGGSYPVAVPTTYGSLAVTDFNSATGVVTYSYTPTGTPFDHSSGEILDSISIDVTDSTLGTASDTLDILITDTTPTAEADAVSIEEDTATFSDNVILGGLTDDTLSADLPVTVVGLAVGATGANLSDGATLDTPLSGTYGTLEIAATGTITYTLNTAHVDVQALTRGDSINDLFTYTISDDDGSESNALITVTINGVDEPTITITDSNAGDTGDITTQEGVELIAESFNITADDGLDRLTIEGVDITEAELLASSSTPIAITTSRGTLTVIAYNDLTDTVLYNYNSSSATPIDHRAGDVLDTISITVTDVNARTATDDLDILIEDSASIAIDDSNSLEEKASSNTVAGNAITDPAGADQLSYDVTSTIVGLAAGDTGANLVDGATIATELAGSYGTLNIQSNGAYTYTLDNDNNTVDNLSRGSSLTDIFTYTLQDADESQTNALITITINGVDEPTITITDDNAGAAGDLTNQEGVEIIDASFTISADDGFDSINIGGTDITEAELLATSDTPIEITTTRGTLTLTEYNNTTGIVLYSYITSSATPIDHRAGDPLDSISITLTDTNARIATDSLDILVQDSASVAVDDSNSIEERPATNTVTGNAITDGAGADQLSYDTPNTVVGLAAGDTSANLADAATIGTDLTGTYGTLSIQSDGSYTYTLDSDNVAVNALSRGDSLTDTFTYTLQDADESQTNALINITINGVDEPTITITDSNDTEAGDITTQEGVEISDASFTISTDDGFDRLTIESTDITEAELLAAGTTPIAITTSRGTLTVTGYNDSTGIVVYDYITSSATPIDHSTGDVLDTITITITDTNARTATDTLDILTQDSSPTAIDDVNSIEERPGADTVTGNAITDAPGADQLNFDTPSTVAGLAVGDTGSDLVDAATIATDLTGSYGTLNIQSNGDYTYTLDNSNSVVNSLMEGESLTDIYTYTLQDSDGSLSSALITITVIGTDEPVITITDSNDTADGDITTQEGVEISAASFNIEAADGLDRLTIEGTDITEAELLATTTAPISIDTSKGTLTVIAYNDTTGVVLYNYTSSIESPIDHRTGDSIDSITITVTDLNARTTSDTLDILIEDSGPTAVADSNSIEEKPAVSTVTGNAITDPAGADQSSFDTPSSIAGLAAGDTDADLVDASTVGTELSGSYGTLNIQSNGDYTYTLDNTNSDVSALAEGESLDDIFTYTLQDSDGSLSSALITITVNGVDEPVITITDSNDTDDGDITTQEGVEISAASFTIEAADGLTLLTIDSTEITAAELLAASTTPIAVTTTRGTLTVTDYDDSTGEVQYNYISSSATPIDHSEGDAIDSVSITVTDSNARATTDTLDILIEDSSSIAVADSNSIEEKPAADTVTGNAITDSEGADQLSYDTPSVVSGLAVGDTDADLVDASTVGTELSGNYGTLNIQSNGDYTYTLDNANIDVNALAAGESLDDIFTYTLQDADGSVTHALITITVNGVDEPVITITDSNDTADGDITTQEGLEISAASFTIEAADGLSLLTIAGTDITAAELLAASTTPIAVTTARGTLTVTDYNDATGVVQYNYLSSSATPIDHREGDPLDSISITVTDSNARATTDTLEILIEDSSSIAVADSNSIEEKPASDTVTGNAITDSEGADQLSYDTPSVVSGLAVGDTDADLVDASTVGTELNGSYGTLNIQSNGDYTYTLDNANIDVNALSAGESLDDLFTYTLQDADGSVTHALITITVNGVDEPVITITDSNDTADGDITTQEGVEISAASFTIEAADGLSLLTIAGTDITAAELLAASTTPIAVTTARGTLTVTDYNDATGVVQYNYLSSSATPIDHREGDPLDSISITVTDNNARATTDTLEILIEDSASIAVPDSNNIDEKPLTDTVMGNAITDATGADQLSYDTPSVIVGIALGDTGSDLIDAGTINTDITGTYGTLSIQSNGDYTYTIDTSNSEVNALNRGESLSDIFTYTLQDADGSLSNTTINITIDGVSEPIVTIEDSNAETDGDITIAETSSGITSSFIALAEDGLDSISISGTDITLAQLLDAENNPIAVTSSLGTITITGYDSSTGETNYEYTLLSAPLDHSSGPILDAFIITTTDVNTRTASDVLDISIDDSVPDAQPDSNDIEETSESGLVTGNLITGPNTPDILSMDGEHEVVGLAAGHTMATLNDPTTLDTQVVGTYGTLQVQADGSYTYVLDQSNAVVNSLQDGMTLLDSFTYTITDDDGSLDYTTVDITVIGIDIPPTADLSIPTRVELPENSRLLNNSFSFTAAEGLATVTVNGNDLTPTDLEAINSNAVTLDTDTGELTLTAYDEATRTITYDFVPRLDSSPEGDTAAMITFTVTDILDYTATSSYEVTIIRPVYDDPLQAEQLRPEILEKLSGQEAFVGFAVVEQSPLSEYRSLTPDIDHLLFGAEQDQGVLDTRPNSDQLFEVPESIALEHELQMVKVFNSAFDKIMKEVEAEENNINPIGSAITVPQMLSGPSIVSGEAFNYRIPPNTFSHTDSSSELAYQAEMADGQGLPQWLKFNAETGAFSGKAPADFSGELEIKIMASDAAGRQVETTLIIQINPDDNLTSFQGKAGLSEQLQSQNVFAWKQNQDQLAALSKALNELSTARESEV